MGFDRIRPFNSLKGINYQSDNKKNIVERFDHADKGLRDCIHRLIVLICRETKAICRIM